ncbi:MAG: DmsC/YnfH family molybdoenzyme membrane anchor subunit [Pseudomonadota bacterium]
MHPAASVIIFTVISGLGYGLIITLSLAELFALAPLSGFDIAFGLTLALCLVAGGLLSSLFHLGHPERAWRALSQWRSSWLSREGVAAILSMLPPMGIIFVALFPENFAIPSFLIHILFALSGVLALVTIFSTAMIYRSLRTIDAWFNNWVPIGFLVLALAGGSLLATAIIFSTHGEAGSLPLLSLIFVGLSMTVKISYWQNINRRPSVSSIETALGVQNTREVKQFVPPHSGENYLMQEMGFRIARKHAAKLRKLCVVLGFVGSLVLLLPVLFEFNGVATASLWLAVIAMVFGLFIERWLFFAEAKHTVGLYYGR